MSIFGIDIRLSIGSYFKMLVDWLEINLDPLWTLIASVINWMVVFLENTLIAIPLPVLLLVLILIAWKLVGRSGAIFTAVAFLIIAGMDLWRETMQNLSLVIVSAIIALGIGIPVGDLGLP